MTPSALKSTLHPSPLCPQFAVTFQQAAALFIIQTKTKFSYFSHSIFHFLLALCRRLYSISMHRVQPILGATNFITFFISPPLIFSIRFILSPAQPFESEPRRPAVGAAEYFGEIYMRNIGGGAHFQTAMVSGEMEVVGK